MAAPAPLKANWTERRSVVGSSAKTTWIPVVVLKACGAGWATPHDGIMSEEIDKERQKRVLIRSEWGEKLSVRGSVFVMVIGFILFALWG